MSACEYCGTDPTRNSCNNCGAPLPEESSVLLPEDPVTDAVDSYYEFVKQYAPLKEGVLYNYFVWPLVVMVVSLVYAVKLIISKEDWTNDRWRVYVLLFLFAPLGLWGVYRSRTIPALEKTIVYVFTVILVIVYSIFGK